jgi:hypothetical protein
MHSRRIPIAHSTKQVQGILTVHHAPNLYLSLHKMYARVAGLATPMRKLKTAYNLSIDD